MKFFNELYLCIDINISLIRYFQQIPEVLNATTGKLENGQPSLLCKQSMFARWQYITKRLPSLELQLQSTVG